MTRKKTFVAIVSPFIVLYARSPLREDEDYANPNDDISGKSGKGKNEIQPHSNM